MRLNEKNVANYATCSSPVDKEGWLNKRGELNKSFQKRWFVLKGNLLYYFEKRGDKDPIGVIILEGAIVELADGDTFTFHITFQGYSTRTYIVQADSHAEMTDWMRAVSMANYDYMKSMVEELQRQFDQMTQYDSEANFGTGDEVLLGAVGGRKTAPAAAVAFNLMCAQDVSPNPKRTTFYLENQYEKAKTQCLPRSTVPRDYPGINANDFLRTELKKGPKVPGLDDNGAPPPPIPPRSKGRPPQAKSMFFEPTPISQSLNLTRAFSTNSAVAKSGSLPRLQSQATGHSVFHDQVVSIRTFREMHEEFGMLIIKKVNEHRLARDQRRMQKPMPPLPPGESDTEGPKFDLRKPTPPVPADIVNDPFMDLMAPSPSVNPGAPAISNSRGPTLTSPPSAADALLIDLS